MLGDGWKSILWGTAVFGLLSAAGLACSTGRQTHATAPDGGSADVIVDVAAVDSGTVVEAPAVDSGTVIEAPAVDANHGDPEVGSSASDAKDESGGIDAPFQDLQADVPSSGNDTESETSETGGQDGPRCPFTVVSLCDDGNPCTNDLLDERCVCTHSPVADDSACTDEDPCTVGDHCVAGTCVGKAQASTAKPLGSITSFASGPDLSTPVALLANDRLAFATGSTLTLTRIIENRIEVLDEAPLGATEFADDISPWIWILRPRIFLLGLSPKLLAVVGTRWGIDLYDISEDRLARTKHFPFTDTSDVVDAAVTDGSRIWMYKDGTQAIQSYWVASPDQVAPGPSFPLPSGNCVGAILLVPGSKTLVCAGSGGLTYVDVSNPDGTMASVKRALEGQYLVHAAMDEHYLVVYKLGDTYSGVGDAVVALDGTSLKQVAEFQARADGESPNGFALVSGTLLLQTYSSSTCFEHAAETYALAQSGATLLSRWILCAACKNPACQGGRVGPTQGRGSYAVLDPTHQVVRVDPVTGAMTPLSGPRQGSFERVRRASSGIVEAHSSMSVHLVDISQPSSPTVRQGGLLVPVNVESLRLELAAEGPAFLPVEALAGPMTSLIWSTSGDKLPEVAGTLATPDGGFWAASPGFVYQLSSSNALDSRLRRFPSTQITKDLGQTLVADIDQQVDMAPPAELPERRSELHFNVERRTGDIVVADERAAKGASYSDTTTVATWLSRDGDHYQTLFTQSLGSGLVSEVAVSGDRALLLSQYQAVLLASTGKILATYKPDKLRLLQILGFNGKQVYLSFTDLATRGASGVVVLAAPALTEVARYPTSNWAMSMAEVDGKLVFGMQSSLLVAAPACPESNPSP